MTNEETKKMLLEKRAERELNETEIKGKKNTITCYEKEGYAKISNEKNNEKLKIDNDEKLIEHIKDRNIYPGEKYYRITKGNPNGYEYFHKEVYSYISRESDEDIKGYEIDHLNSERLDNRFSNLFKLDKKVHSTKLKEIDEFKMHDIGLSISKDITNNNIMVILRDFGIYKNHNQEEGTTDIAMIYENSYNLFLLYSNPEIMIEDIAIFNKGDIRFKDATEKNKFKLMMLADNTKADKVLKCKLTPESFGELEKGYFLAEYLTNGTGKGTMIDDFYTKLFNVFDMSDAELLQNKLIRITN